METSGLRFAVNLSILFTELPLLERPAAAAAAGFDAVELWWPWPDLPVAPATEVDALREALKDAGTQLVGLNFYAGQLPGPDRGAASIPAWSTDFRANLDHAAEFAGSVGCTALNALYGNRVGEATPEQQDRLAMENLARAAHAADRVGATVLIEASNAHESPDYPLVSSRAAVDVVDRLNEITGLGNAQFLCDLYHLSRMDEDLAGVLETYSDKIGHIQIADNPGRSQPGTGDLDFPGLFEKIAATGYDGWIGLEYKPTGPSAQSFGWLPLDRRASHRI